MSGKQKPSKKVSIGEPKVANRRISPGKKTNYLHFIPIVFITLYLLVDFVPEWGGIDVMGSQWVYLAVINLLSTGYIFCFSKDHGYEAVLKRLFSRYMTVAYVVFLLWAGISIFFAINRTEALFCYTTVIITVIAFLNIAVLLSGRTLAFKTIAQILSIILLVQSVNTLSTFFGSMENTSLDVLIYNIKGNTGNKNIFAASMAVKLSFVMYCVYTFKSWSRLIHIPSLILGAIALFFVNARSAYLGLILETMMFIGLVLLQYFRDKTSKEVLVRAVPVVGALLIAFVFAQMSLKHAEKLSVNASGYGYASVTERLKSLAATTKNDGRVRMWLGGLDYVKKHPLIGSGIGNCKLAIIPYEKEWIRDFQFAKHLHDDFIQTAMETGVLGGLLFISLFVCTLVYTVKVWRSKADDQYKVIAVFSLIALAGYTIDALFNFPAERPIMQLLFALILGVNVSVFMDTNEEKVVLFKSTKVNFTTLFGVISILFLLDAVYYKYIAYQSLIAQGLTISDFPNKATHNWREVNDRLPDAPNLDANNIPIDVIRAWYLLDDKKYDEALVLLNRSTKVNPYNMANEFVKAQVFFQTNKLDSAWYYSRKSFENRPNNVAIYTLYNNLCVRRGDTLSIHKAFKKSIKMRNEPMIWNTYIVTLTNMNYNKTKLLAILDSALKQFPSDGSIQERNYATRAGIAYAANQIDTALTYFSKLHKLNPVDNSYTENVGICYYVLKKYDLAVPYFDQIIAANVYANGKPEYFKGICLSKLGKQEQACFFLKLANARNFPPAKTAVTYCK